MDWLLKVALLKVDQSNLYLACLLSCLAAGMRAVQKRLP
jgi:hypothetical protein